MDVSAWTLAPPPSLAYSSYDHRGYPLRRFPRPQTTETPTCRPHIREHKADGGLRSELRTRSAPDRPCDALPRLRRVASHLYRLGAIRCRLWHGAAIWFKAAHGRRVRFIRGRAELGLLRMTAVSVQYDTLACAVRRRQHASPDRASVWFATSAVPPSVTPMTPRRTLGPTPMQIRLAAGVRHGDGAE